jgi:tungstate transport system permease protein
VQDFTAAFGLAFGMIAARDPAPAEIALLSLRVTLSAVAIACALGLPLGAGLGVLRFPGRGAIIVLLNASMGLPLLIYLLSSGAGPLGVRGLLCTPTAMIIAQTVLVLPIVAALTRQTSGRRPGSRPGWSRSARARRSRTPRTAMAMSCWCTPRRTS